MDTIHLIVTYAMMLGVDPALALSVATVESNMQHNKIGPSHGEIGLFQIRPEFSGYSRKALLNPYVNTMAGINRIKEVMRRCKYKDDLQYLICYNMGYEGAKRIKHPTRNRYVLKVKREMEKYK